MRTSRLFKRVFGGGCTPADGVVPATPKGLHPKAQGCRTRLPWVTWRAEDESGYFDLEEVAAYTAPYFWSSLQRRRNPFNVTRTLADGVLVEPCSLSMLCSRPLVAVVEFGAPLGR